MGEFVQFSHAGETFRGYLARAEPAGPGVIVLQEWWGLVGHITDVADRFAAEGFTALAPDLYRGKSTTEPDEAGSLMMALNIAETELQLRAAVQALQHDPGTVEGKVGVVGFCMGGQLSMLAACENPEIGACVNFYGIHPKVQPDFSKLEAPILGLFAELDDYASPAAVTLLSSALSDMGKRHEFHTYPGTHHAFFNNDRPAVYSESASSDAWSRVLAFFRSNLP
jgi:carboxymethylenebutenolidase